MKSNKTPGEEYNMPVIGRIWSKLEGTINGEDLNSPEDSFEVILIQENDNGFKTYVCNEWNAPGKPQLIPDIFVIRFEEK